MDLAIDIINPTIWTYDACRTNDPELLAFAHQQIVSALPLCESPIEKEILPWLVFADYSPFVRGPIPVHVSTRPSFVPTWPLVLVAQMSFMRSRFDFALLARIRTFSKIFAIECDGFDFHDVREDQRRDKYFEGWGIKTIRATGKEIKGRPTRVIERVVRAVTEWADAIPSK